MARFWAPDAECPSTKPDLVKFLEQELASVDVRERVQRLSANERGFVEALLTAEQFEEAEQAFERCLEMSARSPYCLRYQIALFGLMGRFDEAYDYLNRSTQRFPNRQELAQEWQGAGFKDVKSKSFMMGSIAAHLAQF